MNRIGTPFKYTSEKFTKRMRSPSHKEAVKWWLAAIGIAIEIKKRIFIVSMNSKAASLSIITSTISWRPFSQTKIFIFMIWWLSQSSRHTIIIHTQRTNLLFVQFWIEFSHYRQLTLWPNVCTRLGLQLFRPSADLDISKSSLALHGLARISSNASHTAAH